MADVVKGSVLLTPRFDNLTSTVSKELEGAFGSSKGASKAGGLAAGLFGDGFSAKVGAIAGAVSSVASKAMDVVSSSIGSAVSRVDTMNAFPKVLAGLGYSAGDADSAVSKMSDHLTGLPTRLDAMTSSVQKIVPTVKDVGRSTDIMLAFNDALLAGGASTEVQQAALEQFTQVLSKGKPELEDWRSIQQAMPGQLDQVAKAMLGPTASSNDLYEALKSGKVSVSQLEDAFVSLDQTGYSGFDSFATQARNGTAGIATSFANLQNSVVKGVAGIIQAIGPEAITGPMQMATQAIGQLSSGVAQGVTDAKSWLSQLWQAFVPQVDTGLFSATAWLIGGIADSVGSTVGALAGLSAQFVDSGAAAAVFDSGVDAVNSVLSVVGHAVSGVSDWVGQLVSQLEQNGSMQSFADAATAVGDAIGSIVDVVGTVIDDLASFVGSSDSAKGAADALKGALDGVKAVADSVSGVFDALSRNIDLVEPAMTGLAAAMATFKVSTGITDAVTHLGDLKAAADLAKEAMSGGEGAFKAISDAVGALGSDAGPAASGIGSVAGKLATLQESASKAGGGIKGLSSALGLGPWGLVAVAIAAVVAGLVWFFTQTETGRKAWESFTSFLSSAAQAVADAVTGAFQAVADFVTQTVPGAIQSVVDFVAGIPAQVGSLLAQIPAQVSALASQVATTVTTGLQSLGQALLQAIANLPTLLATALGFVVGFVVGLVATVLSLFVQGVATLASSVVAGLQALPGAVSSLLQAVVAAIAAWAASVAAQAVAAGTAFVTGVVTFFQELPGSVASLLSSVVSAVVGWASEMASEAASAGSQFISNVASGMAQLPGRVQSWVSGAISAIAGFVANCASSAVRAGQSFLSGIQGGFNAAVSFVRGIPGQIIGVFAGAGSWLLDSGRSLLNGFTSGIRSGFEAAKNAVSSGLSAIRSFFPFSPAKVGPFSGHGYTTYSGRALMGGFGEGILAGVGRARAAAATALSAVRSAMSAAPLEYAALGDRPAPRPGRAGDPDDSPLGGGTVVNQRFETRVVRSDEDIYSAAAVLNRAALKAATEV